MLSMEFFNRKNSGEVGSRRALVPSPRSYLKVLVIEGIHDTMIKQEGLAPSCSRFDTIFLSLTYQSHPFRRSFSEYRKKYLIWKWSTTCSIDVLHPDSSARALSKIPFLEVHVVFDIHLSWGSLLTCNSNITGRARIIATVCTLSTGSTARLISTCCRFLSSTCSCTWKF